MDDLVAKIRAALDEDERAAREELELSGPAHPGYEIEYQWVRFSRRVGRNGTSYSFAPGAPSPERMLKQVAAHGKLLEGHDGCHRCDWGEHRGGDFEPCSLVLTLAAAYEIDAEETSRVR